jgi:hypothetical protein
MPYDHGTWDSCINLVAGMTICDSIGIAGGDKHHVLFSWVCGQIDV